MNLRPGNIVKANDDEGRCHFYASDLWSANFIGHAEPSDVFLIVHVSKWKRDDGSTKFDYNILSNNVAVLVIARGVLTWVFGNALVGLEPTNGTLGHVFDNDLELVK